MRRSLFLTRSLLHLFTHLLQLRNRACRSSWVSPRCAAPGSVQISRVECAHIYGSSRCMFCQHLRVAAGSVLRSGFNADGAPPPSVLEFQFGCSQLFAQLRLRALLHGCQILSTRRSNSLAAPPASSAFSPSSVVAALSRSPILYSLVFHAIPFLFAVNLIQKFWFPAQQKMPRLDGTFWSTCFLATVSFLTCHSKTCPPVCGLLSSRIAAPVNVTRVSFHTSARISSTRASAIRSSFPSFRQCASIALATSGSPGVQVAFTTNR